MLRGPFFRGHSVHILSRNKQHKNVPNQDIQCILVFTCYQVFINAKK